MGVCAVAAGAAGSTAVVRANTQFFPSTITLTLKPASTSTPASYPLGTTVVVTGHVTGHNPTTCTTVHPPQCFPNSAVFFWLYPTSDATCIGSPAGPIFASGPLLFGAHGRSASAKFTPTAAGTYHWLGKYGGNSDNLASQSCVPFVITQSGGGIGGITTTPTPTPTFKVSAATAPVPSVGTGVDLGGSLIAGGLLIGGGSGLILLGRRLRRRS